MVPNATVDTMYGVLDEPENMQSLFDFDDFLGSAHVRDSNVLCVPQLQFAIWKTAVKHSKLNLT